MKTADFDYTLPTGLIAQRPVPKRTESRLLHLDGMTGTLHDAHFADLPGYFRAGDLVVLNDTRVVKARLFGRKASGGRVEVMVERVTGEHEVLAFVRASHAPRPGSRLTVDPGIDVDVLDREDDLFRLRFDSDDPVYRILERHGRLPLPPYITHAPDASDEERYQTVFARAPGAVAAPTAGLHFDAGMLGRLRMAGVNIAFVTLHVGAATFAPVRVEEIREHRMHRERYVIPDETVQAVADARAAGGRVAAVGTTALRALEAASGNGELEAGEGETDLFVAPGYHFRVVDRLITNFHLPRSTLLMLVCAFGGTENIRRAYAHAIAQRYRFFSYGDAMLIERGDGA
jgi:S-adenosylmethionine:tRNA ribosyltransferase-isomerase